MPTSTRLRSVEIVSECCGYRLQSGRCSSCWESVVGVPVEDEETTMQEKEAEMRSYAENNDDADEKTFVSEPDEDGSQL